MKSPLLESRASFLKVKQKVCARITISLATDQDREIIFQLRHQVYARELGQHQENSTERLTDSLDSDNVYLVASLGNKIVGFISITPPTSPTYSIDKYLQREQLPFPFDDKLYEIRLLTVAREYRGRPIAALLMYSAFRWVEAHGGTRIMAIGRHEILDLYMKAGLQTVGFSVQSGRVNYEVLQTSVSELREHFGRLRKIFDKIESEINWQLNFSFQKPAACFHGGAFFKQI
ncbi:MAG: GNAT family N-acetyltransferase [Verrucomicrobiota bacterium]